MSMPVTDDDSTTSDKEKHFLLKKQSVEHFKFRRQQRRSVTETQNLATLRLSDGEHMTMFVAFFCFVLDGHFCLVVLVCKVGSGGSNSPTQFPGLHFVIFLSAAQQCVSAFVGVCGRREEYCLCVNE
ncbi:unnamed protein product [Pylaiella littoralis]